MKKHIFLLLTTCIAGCLFTSCKEEDITENKKRSTDYNVWIINEGQWQYNNASLTAFNSLSQEIAGDFFSEINGRGLGDVANDIIVYGGKAYIVVNLSSTLEIVRTSDGKSLQQLSFFDGETARQPRRICAGNGKVFVCCYDGSVHRIDTTSLQVEAMGKAGSNPDGICLSGNKLYVSNSGGMNHPVYDSTLSVMDAQSLKVIKNIKVRCNPSRALSDAYGHIWVMSSGNYQDIASCIQCIDTDRDSVTAVYEEAIADFDLCTSKVYLLCYGNKSAVCKTIDMVNLKLEPLFEKTGFTAINSISCRPQDGSIWITDALDYSSKGNVYAFDAQGQQKHFFEAGVCPKRAVFLK